MVPLLTSRPTDELGLRFMHRSLGNLCPENEIGVRQLKVSSRLETTQMPSMSPSKYDFRSTTITRLPSPEFSINFEFLVEDRPIVTNNGSEGGPETPARLEAVTVTR
uniref:Uncharacterized protein n=1 Tax=Romanomermis culicivorax TaxID=13658 RepID=A0A915JR46_ROMCU